MANYVGFYQLLTLNFSETLIIKYIIVIYKLVTAKSFAKMLILIN
jgi:hypothetical protein